MSAPATRNDLILLLRALTHNFDRYGCNALMFETTVEDLDTIWGIGETKDD